MNPPDPIDPGMSPPDSSAAILRALTERAKELDCLYKVDALLKEDATPIPEILRGIVQCLPPGYQYPAVCEARVAMQDCAAATPGF